MKTINLFLVLITFATFTAFAQKREFYEIKIYTYKGAEQEKQIDDYLKNAYLPGVHRAGISKVGVFKPIESDTALFGKRIFVLTPFKSLDQFVGLNDVLQKDKAYLEAGKNYIDAVYSAPPFARLESIILQAFTHQPNFDVPKLSSSPGERIYELRSYEGHTEKISKNKIKMFNEGGEVALFKRLGFNAVFYGEVLAGGKMPNLMYMTSFENKTERDAHWKAFVDAPEWKSLIAMPEYKNNMLRMDVYLLHPAAYSEL